MRAAAYVFAMIRTIQATMLSAALAACSLLTPSVARAATSRATTGSDGAAVQMPPPTLDPGFKLSVHGGFEHLSGDTGFSARVDGEKDLVLLADKLKVAGVFSVGWSRFSESTAALGAFSASSTTNVFKFVPAARFIFPVQPKLDIYGDAGIGIYHARTSFDVSGIAGFSGSDSSSTTGLMLRFGAGGRYRVTDAAFVSAEFDISPYFGDLSATGWGALVGVGIRI
jgi:hypothetical protein